MLNGRAIERRATHGRSRSTPACLSAALWVQRSRKQRVLMHWREPSAGRAEFSILPDLIPPNRLSGIRPLCGIRDFARQHHASITPKLAKGTTVVEFGPTAARRGGTLLLRNQTIGRTGALWLILYPWPRS